MAAPLALVAVTAAWLFVGAGGVRTVVVWLAFGVLALCLGAVGDDQQAEVERKLSGRAVEVSTSWVAAGFWILVTLALCAGWWREGVTRRGARSTGEDWVALRVRVTGGGKHTDAPPPSEGTDQAAARERRENTRQLKCLLLAVDGTDRTVPFHGELSSTVAGTVLAGASGLLMWHPQRRRGKDMLAELIGDDGWQLPGAVPARVAQDMAAAPGPDRGALPGAGRQVRLLDLGAAWSATVPKPMLAGLVCSLLSMGVLLAVPDNGAWRLWAGAAGLPAPLAALLVRALGAAPDSE